MSLHRRLQSLNVDETPAQRAEAEAVEEALDPFVELKTKIHKAVIQSVGPSTLSIVLSSIAPAV